MAKQLQLRRGTTLQNNAFIGAVGEPTLDTETGMIHIHDGQTQGGMEFIDAVVAFQKPTAENNYTWYRKYASGWVEQGGVIASIPSSKYQDVVFPVVMANANYTPSATASWSDTAAGQNEGVQNLTTTGMRVTASYATVTVWWQVKGMAA